jgi:hypothetical protein
VPTLDGVGQDGNAERAQEFFGEGADGDPGGSFAGAGRARGCSGRRGKSYSMVLARSAWPGRGAEYLFLLLFAAGKIFNREESSSSSSRDSG